MSLSAKPGRASRHHEEPPPPPKKQHWRTNEESAVFREEGVGSGGAETRVPASFPGFL